MALAAKMSTGKRVIVPVCCLLKDTLFEPQSLPFVLSLNIKKNNDKKT